MEDAGGGADATDVAERLRRILAGLRVEVSPAFADDASLQEAWQTLDGQLRLVSGRLALLRLSARLRTEYGFTVGQPDIARAVEVDDLNPEIVAVLRAVAGHDAVAEIAADGWETTWPDSASTEGAADESGAAEILDLFEEAGLF